MLAAAAARGQAAGRPAPAAAIRRIANRVRLVRVVVSVALPAAAVAAIMASGALAVGSPSSFA